MAAGQGLGVAAGEGEAGLPDAGLRGSGEMVWCVCVMIVAVWLEGNILGTVILL